MPVTTGERPTTRRAVTCSPHARHLHIKQSLPNHLCRASLVAIALAAGCAAQKQWETTGGSRADGTVTTAYEYTWLESPTVDNAQGVEAAAASCANWGYTTAEPFGGMKHSCEAHDG